MKDLMLKLNHLLFWWYYSKIDDHFKQYTFFKSVNLLRQHWEHSEYLLKSANEVNRKAMTEIEKYRREAFNLKMQQIANPGTIDQLNKMFGSDIDNPKDN